MSAHHQKGGGVCFHRYTCRDWTVWKDVSYWEGEHWRAEQRMMGRGGCGVVRGRHLEAPSDEPDLVPTPRNAGVLVDGQHKGVGAEVVAGAHNLPQQANLATHRLLRGGAEERPAGNGPIRESLDTSLPP